MDEARTHEMLCERIYSSGAQEWRCPTCGRRLLVRWLPSLQMQMLVPGDQEACHTGGRAEQVRRGLTADNSPSLYQETPHDSDFEADDGFSLNRLRPWLKWVREEGLDDLWNQAT